MRTLTDEEIVDVLTGNGIGVLALSGPDERPPYPIPVAYGYDPERDLFALHLEGDAGSEKFRRLERDSGVGFSVHEETEHRTVWRSVVVRGELVESEYATAEPALARLAENTQFAPNPIDWSDSGSIQPYELRAEAWSGREFRTG